jgi:hypothetical protein
MPEKICRRIELALVGLALVILIYRTNVFRFLTTVILLPGCLVLGFTASVVTQDRWPTFRATAVVYAITFLILAFIISQALTYLSARPISQNVASGFFVLLLSALACFNLNHYVVYPQKMELAMVTSQVRRTDFDKVERIIVVPAADKDSLTHRVFFDEFGQPSTAKWWVWQPILRLVMKKVFPKSYDSLKQIPIVADSTGVPSADPNARIIDFRQLRTMR